MTAATLRYRIGLMLVSALTALAALAVGAGIALLFFSATAEAHGWYTGTNDPVTKFGCCGGQDCGEVPEEAVQKVPGGYIYLPTGESIPQSRIQRSRDWRFHRCEYLSTFTTGKGTFKQGDTRCFFEPGGSM